jgi:hypothetical protein
METVAKQLTHNYDWRNIPQNHSGCYWRDSLFTDAGDFEQVYDKRVDVVSKRDLRFNLVDLNIQQAYDRVMSVMSYNDQIIAPEITRVKLLCLELKDNMEHAKDQRKKDLLRDQLHGYENRILMLEEPSAQIRAFNEIVTHM